MKDWLHEAIEKEKMIYLLAEIDGKKHVGTPVYVINYLKDGFYTVWTVPDGRQLVIHEDDFWTDDLKEKENNERNTK